MDGVSITEIYVGHDLSDDYWTLDANWATVQPTPEESYGTVDLGLSSGRLWASMNIGATSVYDYGQYFQWGDTVGYGQSTSDGKDFTWASYKFGTSATSLTKYNSSDKLTVLERADDAAIANMGGNWRMPTTDDFNELLDPSACSYTAVSDYEGSGVSGILFISESNSNKLFFPNSGYRGGTSINGRNNIFYYWSSSTYLSSRPGMAYAATYESGSITMPSTPRYFGLPIRGVI